MWTAHDTNTYVPLALVRALDPLAVAPFLLTLAAPAPTHPLAHSLRHLILTTIAVVVSGAVAAGLPLGDAVVVTVSGEGRDGGGGGGHDDDYQGNGEYVELHG